MTDTPDIGRKRFLELDWIRIIVVLNLVPFHVAWLMTSVPKFSNINQSHFLTYPLRAYVMFCSPLHMFILFFIAGISTAAALRNRTVREYIRERIKRLLVPLLFFMVCLFPVLGYFWPGIAAEKSFGDYILNFWPSLMPHFFNGGGERGGPIWGHMWFVGYLLIISFLLLPLLIYFQKPAGKEKLTRFFSIFTTGYGIFLPAVPVILIFAVLSPVWPFFQNNLHTDWAHFTYHMLAFFLGFVMVSDSRFMETIDRVFRPALFGGAVLSIIKIIMDAYVPAFSKPAHHLNYAVYSMAAGLNTWCWVIAILGIARKRLNFSNRFLKYVNRISYPFYIWHLVITVVAGYYITRRQLGVDIEFLLLCLVTFGGSLLACELVKRFKITRFLFGIK